MYLCDLHCDTALSLYEHRQSLRNNTKCAISLNKMAVYNKYIQCAAVYTDTKLDNEQGWQQFFRVRRNFLDECEKNDCLLCTDGNVLSRFLKDTVHSAAFILTVEDARILDSHPERLEILYNAGVRILTPVWGGNSCIGGAHNTDNGLTPFGKDMAEEALTRGMILDISHASLPAADEILAFSRRYPGQICASHSNAFAITPHRRNLTDTQMYSLANAGGIVGINLYIAFLRKTGNASAEDVLRHMEYCIRLCGEDHVAFGCDFDGAETPSDLPDAAHLLSLIPLMQKNGYSEEKIEKIFYKNAFRFLVNALK